MGQIQLTTSLILIGLFTVAILGFAINFAIDNDAVIDISDDAQIVSLYSDSASDVGDWNDNSTSQYQSIIETTIAPDGSTPQSAGSFAITPINAIGVAKNIMQVGYIKIFGTGSGFGIFLSTLIGVIGFMFALFIYKTWRGIPD